MQRLILILPLAVLAACVGKLDTDNEAGQDDAGPGDSEPLCVVESRSYPSSLGSHNLEADRIEQVGQSDRARLKPFAALATDIERVTGIAVNTDAYADTFGKPPARWFEEPEASANTLYAGFLMLFDACTDYTADGAMFANAPTAEEADMNCRAMARSFWNREATDEQASACASYALATDANEGPRRRWALSCASVLSAAGFLTY